MMEAECPDCGEKIDLYRYKYFVNNDTRYQVCFYCQKCGHKSEWIGKAVLEKFEVYIPHLPIINPEVKAPPKVKCAVCGSENQVQEHHWFPIAYQDRMLLPANMKWRNFTTKLCLECHREWHDNVTPFLPGCGKKASRETARQMFIEGQKRYYFARKNKEGLT